MPTSARSAVFEPILRDVGPTVTHVGRNGQALLLKIAARRANRLHSPRPGEVAAVLDEVSRSLARSSYVRSS